MGKLDNYVPVHVRVMQARTEHGNALSIRTQVQMYPEKNTALVGAIVSIGQNVLASGHAIAEDLSEPKSLEKAESVAVGRALAFAGYSADASIASAEEMEDFATATSASADDVNRTTATQAKETATAKATAASSKPTRLGFGQRR